jgi:N-acetylmuramoyl-L-alanine amidase
MDAYLGGRAVAGVQGRNQIENFRIPAHSLKVMRRNFALVSALAVALSAAGAPAHLPVPEWRAPNVLGFLKLGFPAAALGPSISELIVHERAAPATPSFALPVSLTRAMGLNINRIAIDAGHGGPDFGAMSATGMREKDVVLDIALRVARLVRQSMKIGVVLTRSADVFVALRERTAIADNAGADLFVSIHANSSPSKAAAGAETFTLSLSAGADGLEIARRENAGAGHSVGQLRDLVRSIALNEKVLESETLAEMLQTPLSIQAAKANAASRNRGVRRAPFLVLLGASMPSVLTEVGFLSNPAEAAKLADPAYREQVAVAIFAGIAQYADSLNSALASP